MTTASPRTWITRVAVVATLGLATATVLSFLGGLWWVLDLASHFRVQYAVAGAIFAAVLAAAQSWRWAAVALLVTTMSAAHVGPELVASRPRLAEGNDRLRLILFNVERQSQEFDAAMALLRARDPDVLVLLEIDARWTDALEPVLARYPHRVVELRADNFGIGLYSKRPLEDARIEHITARRVPIALATVQLGGGPVRLIAAHPPPPVSAVLSRERDVGLGELAVHASTARAAGQEVVLAGDLNTTPWSRSMAVLSAQTGLSDSRRGFGLQASWPARSRVLRIPIDHVLLSDGLATAHRRVGPQLGSDHLPVHVELARRDQP